MIPTRPVLLALGLIVVLSTIAADQLFAANMRTFNEAVRRNAAVVLLGSVKEVSQLQRTRFDIKARALIQISKVLRGPADSPSTATLEYSSFDERTPMHEGGPQYELRPGDQVVLFAGSFASTIPPGYLIHGKREELRQRVEALRDNLKQMSAEQLKLNEINEEDRHSQLALYEKLCTFLQTP